MYLFAIPAALVLLVTAALVIASRRPVEVGPIDGRLRPCSPKPNCVCSQGSDETHSIEPLRFEGDPDRALGVLRSLLEAEPLAGIEDSQGDWMHAVWRTMFLGFRDDVEFLLDREAGVIHLRSASRVGRSDFGANRARVERLRQRFTAALAD